MTFIISIHSTGWSYGFECHTSLSQKIRYNHALQTNLDVQSVIFFLRDLIDSISSANVPSAWRQLKLSLAHFIRQLNQ